MLASQQFCVKWNSYSSNLQNVFPRLLTSEHFVDITLACEGQMIKCHKVVLSACSTYFEKLLVQNPCQHPIIFMKDMKHWEVQALVDFMYKGEVNVSQDELNSLLVAAEALQIRGLCGSDHVNRPDGNRPSSSSGVSKIPLPHDMVLSGSTAVGRDSPPSCKRRRPPNEEKDQFQPALPRISNVTSASVNSKGGSITDVNPLPTSQMPIVDQIKTDGPEDDMDQDIPEKRTIKQEVDMEDSYLEGDMDADGPDEDYGSLEHRDDSDSNNCEDTHPGSPLDQPGPSGMVPPTSAPVEKGATELNAALALQNVACVLSSSSGKVSIQSSSNASEPKEFVPCPSPGSGGATRIRRSEAELKEAAECVQKGMTFQNVSDMFNIPISTIRFYMARRGILPQRRRGRISNSSQNPATSQSQQPPYMMLHYKLPDIIKKVT